MVDLQVRTTTGGDSLLSEATVDEFKGSLRGELLQPADQGYEEARAIWNGLIDRRPSLIAQCTGVADVIAAVNFASKNELLSSPCAEAGTAGRATRSATAA